MFTSKETLQEVLIYPNYPSVIHLFLKIGGLAFSNAKPLHYPIDNLCEDNAEADTEHYEQTYKGLSTEIDSISIVDNLIAPFLVLVQCVTNLLAMLFEHSFFLF